MAVELSVLLGGVKRPVILNGQLLCVDRTPVLVSRPAYHVEYKLAGTDKYVSADDGEELIASKSAAFVRKYGDILSGTNSNPAEYLPASVDSYTGAIVLETKAFSEISRVDLHSGEFQLAKTTADLIKQFAAEYTENWFEIYLYLFNRRLSAQHMPYSVRSHLVAGLFQPLVVETRNILSPLRYGENQWFYNIFKEYEENLSLLGDNDKRISISCVAMCDIADIFRVPPMFNLDRNVWMFIVELLLLRQLNGEAAVQMTRRYPRLFSKASYNAEVSLRRQGRLPTQEELDFASHQNYAQLFASMTDYALKLNTQLRMV